MNEVGSSCQGMTNIKKGAKMEDEDRRIKRDKQTPPEDETARD
jgi:hypothetical protein